MSFIFGGLTFLSLTRNFLDAAQGAAPATLAAEAEREARPGEGVVVLASVLSSEVNTGYDDAQWKAVRRVDGREVRSLRELVSLVERPDGGPYVVFGLADGSRVTIDRARAVATGPEVLARYEVASDRSSRLKVVGSSQPLVAAAGPLGGGAVPGGEAPH